MSRPTEILIDLDALKHNCRIAQSLAPNSKTVAVIKADAYGHGAIDIAQALQSQVAMFAVSSIEEAMELRMAGIRIPILLLEGCFSQQELECAVIQGFDVVMHNREQVDMLAQLQQQKGLTVWLKVDTGMHRLGFNESDVASVFDDLSASQSVNQIVLMTHLSVADEVKNIATQEQLGIFNRCVKQIQQISSQPVTVSIANSAAVQAWPNSHGDWNRPGIMLYGLSPFAEPKDLIEPLQPVMTLTSKVIALRQIQAQQSVGYGNTWTAKRASTIATIAVGYGDGYPRNAKSGTPVLVNGQRAQLCGRVSMDMITVDVTDLENVEIGSSVELWGKNLNANEVAKYADTIGYELVTRMPKRLSRRIGQSD
ncbi:alanine racemase [Aliiglaciecola litoralis]|uniref:Alanine racemase n=2 Tax=Aliiglaciecola litoralis TaxID=582857 RepID=A0ABN1LDT9_9ALTE